MVPLSRVPVLSQFIGYLIFLLIISELESKHIEVKFNCRSWFCNFQTGFWIVYILSLSFLFFHLELHGIAETNNILIFMWPVEICFYIDESARLPPGFRRYSSPFSGKLLILFTSLAPSMHLFCVLTFVLWFLQRREVYGAWEQYLGMEHTDTAPKRAYTVNQVCSSYEMVLSNFLMFIRSCSSLFGHKNALLCGLDNCIFMGVEILSEYDISSFDLPW